MARKSRRTRSADKASPRPGVTVLAVAFLLAQVLALPGAHSTFRAPKDALAITALAAVIGLAIALRLYRGRLSVPWGPLPAVLVSYPALLAASALWAASPRHALASAVTTAVWVVAMLGLGMLSSAERRRLITWCTAGVLISAAVMALQAVGVRVLDLTAASGRGRMSLTGLTGNPADFAMAAALLLPFLLPATDEASRRWRSWTLPAVLAFSILLTQTLTGLAALALISLVWIVVQRSPRIWLGALGLAALVVLVALAAGTGKRIARLHQFARGGEWGLALSGRTDGWTAALEMTQRHPLHGVGAGNFTRAFYPARLAYLEERDTRGGRGELATHFRWAHCDPLQVLAELGASGIVWMLALAVVLIRTRPRGDPTLILACAAWAPFALLHYPGHLTVGVIPISLVVAHLIASSEARPTWTPQPSLRPLLALAMLAVVLAISVWQARRVWIELWRGDAGRILVMAEAADPVRRVALTTAVEQQTMIRIPRLPGDAGWMWRLVGQARMVRGDAPGAEAAYRAALELFPHEEAEFGLGLALAAQERRTEALHSLARVCRTNSTLLQLIPDQGLRRSVREYLTAQAGQRG